MKWEAADLWRVIRKPPWNALKQGLKETLERALLLSGCGVSEPENRG